MAVKFSNNAVTTLSAGISAGATSFTVASASTFPTLASGDWTYVSLTSEVVKVTAISGTTFTCDATSAAHASGESVELRMTSELLNDFAEDTEALPLAGGTMTGDVSLGDNVKAKFGASDDLNIFHDGNNSYIVDSGTGGLRIRGSSFVAIQGTNGENGVIVNENGATDLHYNSAKKLATTSTGIDVTGSVTCDGFTSTGIDDNATSTRLTVANSGLTVGADGIIVDGGTQSNLYLKRGNYNQYSMVRHYTAGVEKWRAGIISGSDNYVIWNGTNSATRLTVAEAGNVTVNTGNLVIGTSGKGIDFSATSDGSGTMTSEVLDDYEEGTWTPTLGGFSAVTYTTRLGTYTKVGNMVYVFWDFLVTGTTGTGDNKINGLPFTVSGSMAGYSTLQLRDSSLFKSTVVDGQLSGYAQRSASYMALQVDNANTTTFGTHSNNVDYNLSGRSTGYVVYSV